MRTGKIHLFIKNALRAVGLIVATLCMAFSVPVCAAEENSIPPTSSAKLYMEMSDNSNIIANLIVGNEFEIVGEQLDSEGGRWYRVTTEFGAEGYVKAVELDKLIIDAHELLYSAAIASASAAQTPEDNPDKGEAKPGEVADFESDDTTAPDAVQTGEEQIPDTAQAGELQTLDAVQAGEKQVPDMVQASEDLIQEENNAEGDLAGEESVDIVPESSLTTQNETAAPVSGAGFGEADNTDNDINNDGFTVIERTDQPKQPKEQIHGNIDAVLMMIMAGGVLCIIAIAVLSKKILTCVKTET